MITNNKNILHVDSECIQCHYCEYTCPKKAISFKKNSKGFLYPNISNECINCGKCLQICPILHVPSSNRPIESFHGYSKDDHTRFTSSSGGFFYHIADLFKKEGWLIIATVFFPESKECKYVTSNQCDIKQMQKSKYCESNFTQILQLIKNALAEDKKVFICGTPCHMYAVRHIFGNSSNIFIVDFQCHGVPSQTLLQEDIKMYEKNNGANLRDIDFRYKKTKYSSLTLKLEFENGKRKVFRYYEDRFYYAFEKNWILRDSCYQCKFSSSHFSDITLGDFWNANKYGVKADTKLGHSLVYANSKKGLEIIKKIEPFFVIDKTISLIPYPLYSKKSSDVNKQALFFEYYKLYGYKKACDKLFFSKIKFKSILKKILRKK